MERGSAAYVAAQVAQWDDGRMPEDGPPDRTIRGAGFWVEWPGGKLITDPAWLAELEEKRAAGITQARVVSDGGTVVAVEGGASQGG